MSTSHNFKPLDNQEGIEGSAQDCNILNADELNKTTEKEQSDTIESCKKDEGMIDIISPVPENIEYKELINNDTITDLKQKLSQLHIEKSLLEDYVKRFQTDMSTLLNDFNSKAKNAVLVIEGKVNQKHFEMLDEMKLMNNELNQRSDTISRYKDTIAANKDEIKKHLDEKECQDLEITKLKDELHCIQKQHQLSTIKIKEMESELTRFKDGDALSTSTVSRVDDIARLKDIEDTFEVRYIKLKKVAAKLKKQATEATLELESEKQKVSLEKAELMAKLTQLTATAKTTQTVQQEYDRLYDELEKEKKDANDLRKAAVDIKESEVSLKVKLEEAETAIEVLKIDLNNVIREKEGLTSKLVTKENELEIIKKEKAAEEMIRKEKTKEINQISEKLKEEQEKNAALLKNLEAARIEAKKQSVLTLEIQDYEKSLADMKNQLTAEKTHVSSLEAEVSTLQDIRSSLLEQIKLIEERLETEEVRWSQTNDQLVYTRSCLQSAETELNEQTSKVAQLTDKLENERASSEEAALKLASLSSAVQNSTDVLIKEKQALTQQVVVLTSQLTTTKETLQQKEDDLIRLQDDFDKYKIRAQSVLRKHQSSGPSRAETEARQEADGLRESLELVKTTLDKTREELERTKIELTVSTNEREAAETRCVNLNIALEEKSKVLDRTISEHRTQKLSVDTLLQCYKSQLEEKEKLHQENVDALQEEINLLKKKIKTKHNSSDVPFTSTESQLYEESSQPLLDKESNETVKSNTIPNTPLWERGDGEGSENTYTQFSPGETPPLSPAPYQSSQPALIPLDKLLASNDSFKDNASVEAEIGKLKSKIHNHEVRLHHQAALLSESEQDAARNKELITCLKKEISRLERCIKMQPHAQNTEYLKNIVFKFVTLDHGDDRLRLVPVISTLLQLSPEETQSLTAAAKGEPEATNGSWGSYLPIWR
uniref:GRIP domain-containing protein n=1 Tax=Clastoptera arizonana TaxID=38151 RepID=A0A1B6DFM6_9HEMI